MTIRTTLFPLGYSATNSPQPQPTGDTPLLIGLSYKRAIAEPDVTPPSGYDVGYTLMLQSDVYRYEIDLSNANNIDECLVNIDWGICFPNDRSSQFDSLWGCAFELYVKTPPNELQLVIRHICNGTYYNNMVAAYDWDNKYFSGSQNAEKYTIPANTSLRFEFMRSLNVLDVSDPIFNSLITMKVTEI